MRELASVAFYCRESTCQAARLLVGPRREFGRISGSRGGWGGGFDAPECEVSGASKTLPQAPCAATSRGFSVPRVISFIVLLATVLLVGAVFFQVMAQFIVPLFLACVLLVVCQPLHAWT